MNHIKFIFFDVGGVIIRDFSATHKWTELRRSIGVTPEQDEEFIQLFNTYEGEVCTGKDVESLLPLFTERLGLTFPPGYSFLQDFVNRFEPNPSIWPIVEQIKKTYKVGLLTNQYPGMFNAIKEKMLMPQIGRASCRERV